MHRRTWWRCPLARPTPTGYLSWDNAQVTVGQAPSFPGFSIAKYGTPIPPNGSQDIRVAVNQNVYASVWTETGDATISILPVNVS
jgi:hypothetical protein